MSLLWQIQQILHSVSLSCIYWQKALAPSSSGNNQSYGCGWAKSFPTVHCCYCLLWRSHMWKAVRWCEHYPDFPSGFEHSSGLSASTCVPMHRCPKKQHGLVLGWPWSTSCCHDLHLTHDWQQCSAANFTPSKPKARLLSAQHLCLLLLIHTGFLRWLGFLILPWVSASLWSSGFPLS